MIYFVFILLAGCQSGGKPNIYAAPPQESSPSTPERDKGQNDYPEADRVFTEEVDACFEVYRKCLKTSPDSVCFPPQEKCVVTSYRKFKKAKEKANNGKSNVLPEQSKRR